jgi:hypothetical protein
MLALADMFTWHQVPVSCSITIFLDLFSYVSMGKNASLSQKVAEEHNSAIC